MKNFDSTAKFKLNKTVVTRFAKAAAGSAYAPTSGVTVSLTVVGVAFGKGQ